MEVGTVSVQCVCIVQNNVILESGENIHVLHIDRELRMKLKDRLVKCYFQEILPGLFTSHEPHSTHVRMYACIHYVC